jgi:hypothetical protein
MSTNTTIYGVAEDGTLTVIEARAIIFKLASGREIEVEFSPPESPLPGISLGCPPWSTRSNEHLMPTDRLVIRPTSANMLIVDVEI